MGHLGVGSRLLFGWRARLPALWLYLGCLLPDVIDKPLFYLFGPTPLISGTRTFGHTALFLLAWVLLALLLRRPWSTALAAGIATHFLLDVAGEMVSAPDPESSIWLAIFFPAFGVRFPVAHFATILEHLEISAQSGYVLAGELVGGAILLSAWWRGRRRSAG
ncbi:MAG: metal-dependent hydrolase [Myxococcales bacterium]|nr:metal-dependent hydrolase [Myxococcales bacterium]